MINEYTYSDEPELLIASLPQNPLHSYEYLEFKAHIDRFQNVLKLKTYKKSYKNVYEKMLNFIINEQCVIKNLIETKSQTDKIKFLKIKMMTSLCVSGQLHLANHKLESDLDKKSLEYIQRILSETEKNSEKKIFVQNDVVPVVPAYKGVLNSNLNKFYYKQLILLMLILLNNQALFQYKRGGEMISINKISTAIKISIHLKTTVNDSNVLIMLYQNLVQMLERSKQIPLAIELLKNVIYHLEDGLNRCETTKLKDAEINFDEFVLADKFLWSFKGIYQRDCKFVNWKIKRSTTKNLNTFYKVTQISLYEYLSKQLRHNDNFKESYIANDIFLDLKEKYVDEKDLNTQKEQDPDVNVTYKKCAIINGFRDAKEINPENKPDWIKQKDGVFKHTDCNDGIFEEQGYIEYIVYKSSDNFLLVTVCFYEPIKAISQYLTNGKNSLDYAHFDVEALRFKLMNSSENKRQLVNIKFLKILNLLTMYSFCLILQ